MKETFRRRGAWRAIGLSIALLLVLIPALHVHPAGAGAAGPAPSRTICTLCVTFAATELNAPGIIAFPPAPPISVVLPPFVPRASAEPDRTDAGRAPPTPTLLAHAA